MMALSRSNEITLVDLVAGLVDSADAPPVTVTGIALDSRLVSPGDLFIAVVGTKTDGANYIAQAIEKGAVGVLQDQD